MYSFITCIVSCILYLYSFVTFSSVLLVNLFVYITKWCIQCNVQRGITTMSEATPTSPVVLSNLLASAVFATSTGQTAEDVAITFSGFYSNVEIQEARALVVTVKFFSIKIYKNIICAKNVLYNY